MISFVAVADQHREQGEPEHPSWTLTKRFIADFRPDIIILGGDLLDYRYISSYSQSDEECRRDADFMNEFDILRAELDVLQGHTKKIYYLEGNHEFRLEAYLRQNPILRRALCMEEVLDLGARKIPYILMPDQPLRLGKLAFAHGWYYGVHYSKKTLDEYGGNIVVWHAHRPQYYARRIRATNSEIGCWGLGCLCARDPFYLKGRPNRWQNGFGVGYIQKNGYFNIYDVRITHNQFTYGGVHYETD